jgi:hypothetical protein
MLLGHLLCLRPSVCVLRGGEGAGGGAVCRHTDTMPCPGTQSSDAVNAVQAITKVRAGVLIGQSGDRLAYVAKHTTLHMSAAAAAPGVMQPLTVVSRCQEGASCGWTPPQSATHNSCCSYACARHRVCQRNSTSLQFVLFNCYELLHYLLSCLHGALNHHGTPGQRPVHC